MPPIRAMSLIPNGVRFETQRFGVIDATITGSGNTRTVTVRQDGVQKYQVAISNVTAQKLEDAINNWLAGNLVIALPGGGTVPSLNCAVHVFSVSPLSLTMISTDFDVPIPANWWQA